MRTATTLPTPSIDDPQLIVDLSNVCRDWLLSPDGDRLSLDRSASWRAVERVMAAWRAQMSRSPRGIAIADESLRPLLRSGDRQLLAEAEQSGEVRFVPEADRLILELARSTDAAVLTRDRFVGHRREHPWIQGVTGRFYGWEVDDDGAVSIVALDMGTSTAYSISRGEEADRLKERGLDPRDPADRELLLHVYRCTDARCLTARFTPQRLLVPPAVAGRRPICPGCGNDLQDLGPRAGTVEIVVGLGERELIRRVLEDGATTTIGRADLPVVPETLSALARVGRRHAEVGVEGTMLRVRDLGSRNGIAVARFNSLTHVLEAPRPIGAGEAVQLGHRDVAVLAGTVRVRRSGQQFAVPPVRPAAPGAARGGSTLPLGEPT